MTKMHQHKNFWISSPKLIKGDLLSLVSINRGVPPLRDLPLPERVSGGFLQQNGEAKGMERKMGSH